jgi:hypothetical protein
MLRIVWNPNGFHLINVVSKGIKFNAEHYIINILISLAERRETPVDRTERKLIVHADDACPHTAKMRSDSLEQNGTKQHIIHRTHMIWHHLIFISSAMSNSTWPGTNSLIGYTS